MLMTVSIERPCTWEESEHFRQVQSALRSYFPTVKRGQLYSLRVAVNGSTIFRSASGQLSVQKNLDVLTDDEAWGRKLAAHTAPADVDHGPEAALGRSPGREAPRLLSPVKVATYRVSVASL